MLYNWAAACSSCPSGWHLPTDAEWADLTELLGGAQIAGGKLKETGTNHWKTPNTGATNDTGFTALPGGSRHYGLFSEFEYEGVWWSATVDKDDYDYIWIWSLHYDSEYINRKRTKMLDHYGYSVRCVKN